MQRISVFQKIAFVMVFSIGGCALLPQKSAFQQKKSSFFKKKVSFQKNRKKPSSYSLVTRYATLRVGDLILRNQAFDLPVKVNRDVLRWVDYFTHRGRNLFQKYLDRLAVFAPLMESILRKSRLPEDLIYVAMIESGFHNHARSRARAVGPWQFMASTARFYKLRINWWVDERRDIVKSTWAAAHHFQSLWKRFQNWELALAAYNAGERKIQKAIRRYRTRDFWRLRRFRYLKRETRQYVPKLIAALLIGKNAERFGFEKGRMFIVKEGKKRTPASLIPYGSSQKKVLLSVLSDYRQDYRQVGQTMPASFVESSPFLQPHISRLGQLGLEKVVSVKVRSPASLFQIARAAGISYQTLKTLNPELLRWCTPPWKKQIFIKLPARVQEAFLMTYDHPAFPRRVEFRRYRVRRGDSLYRIARRFGISKRPLKDLNPGVFSKRLRLGRWIRLPLPVRGGYSLFSLGLRSHPRHARR